LAKAMRRDALAEATHPQVPILGKEAAGFGRLATLALLIAILGLAAFLRLDNLIPVDKGLLALQDYDEGVWDTTAQLWLQGHLPYRDFFATLPPVGIYLLAAVLRLVYVPWGSGVGLMATRYASVLYGLLTVALIYKIGNKLSGRPAGLLTAGLLAVDGMVLGMDRLAMLEPPLNLCSALAVLVYLSAFERRVEDRTGQWRVAAAGIFAAMASLAKTPGLVVILALVTVSLLRRRWREAATVIAGFALAWLILCAYFLVQCPDSFLKQVYFFQLLRPADGVTGRLSRLFEMWHYARSWSTVRLGLVGALCAGLLVVWRQEAKLWMVVLSWAGWSWLLIMANSSYYPQYYTQLAVPLCVLAGSLLDGGLNALSARAATHNQHLGLLALIVILAAGVLAGKATLQYREIARLVEYSDSTYAAVAGYLREHSPPETTVLAFEPNYALLASRPVAGPSIGEFLVDSYGGMLYINLGIEHQSLWYLAKQVLTGQKEELQSTFWRQPAQQQVLAAFERADYVVVDGRARYQVEPKTLEMIMDRSAQRFDIGVASLRVREQ
jgi:4-amino-4-deoxy-L-arabinose transferase-like glycosyltransferase